MIRRSKTIIVALLAVFAVGAVASAAASAAPQWQIEGKAFKGEETINITSNTPVVIKSKLPSGGAIDVECIGTRAEEQGEKLGGSLKSSGAEIFSNSKGIAKSLSLYGCAWVQPGKCIAGTGTLTTPRINFSAENVSTEVFSKLEPVGGTLLSWLQTTCPALEGQSHVSGSPRCKFAEPSVQSVVKTCAFTETSGSVLKFGSEAATLTGSVGVELSGANKGKKWGIEA